MKYRIQITSSNPDTIIVTNDRRYDKKAYYDLVTINCNIIPSPIEKLMKGHTLTDSEKKSIRFYIYDVYERRKDCKHYLQVRNDKGILYEVGF